MKSKIKNGMIVLLLMVILVPTVYAANLKGTVYDATDPNNPIPLPSGATILLKDHRLGTINDDDGSYFIKNVPLGERTVTASFIGYEDHIQQITIDDKSKTYELDFELKEQPILLDPLNIVAPRKHILVVEGVPFTGEMITVRIDDEFMRDYPELMVSYQLELKKPKDGIDPGRCRIEDQTHGAWSVNCEDPGRKTFILTINEGMVGELIVEDTIDFISSLAEDYVKARVTATVLIDEEFRTGFYSVPPRDTNTRRVKTQFIYEDLFGDEITPIEITTGTIISFTSRGSRIVKHPNENVMLTEKDRDWYFEEQFELIFADVEARLSESMNPASKERSDVNGAIAQHKFCKEGTFVSVFRLKSTISTDYDIDYIPIKVVKHERHDELCPDKEEAEEPVPDEEEKEPEIGDDCDPDTFKAEGLVCKDGKVVSADSRERGYTETDEKNLKGVKGMCQEKGEEEAIHDKCDENGKLVQIQYIKGTDEEVGECAYLEPEDCGEGEFCDDGKCVVGEEQGELPEEEFKNELKKKIGQMIISDTRHITLNNIEISGVAEGIADVTENAASLDLPEGYFVASDYEGGNVMRLLNIEGLQHRKASDIGEEYSNANNKDEYLSGLYDFALGEGTILRDTAGVNFIWAPVVDIHEGVSPDNIEYGVDYSETRSFSNDPNVIKVLAEQIIKAYQDIGLIATAKHFPGHGFSKGDTHKAVANLEIQRTKDEIWNHELVPYRYLISRGGNAAPKAIMINHLFYPAYDDLYPDYRGAGYPASFSQKIIQGLLRDEMGYEGLIITDELNMESVDNFYRHRKFLDDKRKFVDAVYAGVDILAYYPNPGIVMEAIYDASIEKDEEGQYTQDALYLQQRIDESYNRIMSVKKDIGLLSSDLEGDQGSHNFDSTQYTFTDINNYIEFLNTKITEDKQELLEYDNFFRSDVAINLIQNGKSIELRFFGTVHWTKYETQRLVAETFDDLPLDTKDFLNIALDFIKNKDSHVNFLESGNEHTKNHIFKWIKDYKIQNNLDDEMMNPGVGVSLVPYQGLKNGIIFTNFDLAGNINIQDTIELVGMERAIEDAYGLFVLNFDNRDIAMKAFKEFLSSKKTSYDSTFLEKIKYKDSLFLIMSLMGYNEKRDEYMYQNVRNMFEDQRLITGIAHSGHIKGIVKNLLEDNEVSIVNFRAKLYPVVDKFEKQGYTIPAMDGQGALEQPCDDRPQTARTKLARGIRNVLSKATLGVVDGAEEVCKGCKDDFILIDENGDEVDCWEEDAMCVEENKVGKCVDFEDVIQDSNLLNDMEIIKLESRFQFPLSISQSEEYDKEFLAKLQALERMLNYDAKIVVPFLRRFVYDTSHETVYKQTSVEILGRIGNQDAINALLKILEDGLNGIEGADNTYPLFTYNYGIIKKSTGEFQLKLTIYYQEYGLNSIISIEGTDIKETLYSNEILYDISRGQRIYLPLHLNKNIIIQVKDKYGRGIEKKFKIGEFHTKINEIDTIVYGDNPDDLYSKYENYLKLISSKMNHINSLLPSESTTSKLYLLQNDEDNAYGFNDYFVNTKLLDNLDPNNFENILSDITTHELGHVYLIKTNKFDELDKIFLEYIKIDKNFNVFGTGDNDLGGKFAVFEQLNLEIPIQISLISILSDSYFTSKSRTKYGHPWETTHEMFSSFFMAYINYGKELRNLIDSLKDPSIAIAPFDEVMGKNTIEESEAMSDLLEKLWGYMRSKIFNGKEFTLNNENNGFFLCNSEDNIPINFCSRQADSCINGYFESFSNFEDCRKRMEAILQGKFFLFLESKFEAPKCIDHNTLLLSIIDDSDSIHKNTLINNKIEVFNHLEDCNEQLMIKNFVLCNPRTTTSLHYCIDLSSNEKCAHGDQGSYYFKENCESDKIVFDELIGKRGVLLCQKDNSIYYVPEKGFKVFDECLEGDNKVSKIFYPALESNKEMFYSKMNKGKALLHKGVEDKCYKADDYKSMSKLYLLDRLGSCKSYDSLEDCDKAKSSKKKDHIICYSPKKKKAECIQGFNCNDYGFIGEPGIFTKEECESKLSSINNNFAFLCEEKGKDFHICTENIDNCESEEEQQAQDTQTNSFGETFGKTIKLKYSFESIESCNSFAPQHFLMVLVNYNNYWRSCSADEGPFPSGLVGTKYYNSRQQCNDEANKKNGGSWYLVNDDKKKYKCSQDTPGLKDEVFGVFEDTNDCWEQVIIKLRDLRNEWIICNSEDYLQVICTEDIQECGKDYLRSVKLIVDSKEECEKKLEGFKPIRLDWYLCKDQSNYYCTNEIDENCKGNIKTFRTYKECLLEKEKFSPSIDSSTEIIFIPINWDDSIAQFEFYADSHFQTLQNIAKASNLDLSILNIKKYILKDLSCKVSIPLETGDQEIIEEIRSCVNKHIDISTINPIKDKIIALTDDDMGGLGGYTSPNYPDINVVKYISKMILAHEFGHSSLNLCDEYSYKDWRRQNNLKNCPNSYPSCCFDHPATTDYQGNNCYPSTMEKEDAEKRLCAGEICDHDGTFCRSVMSTYFSPSLIKNHFGDNIERKYLTWRIE